MAEVDFSHARIQPATSYGGHSNLENPAKYQYVSLATVDYLYDINENTIASLNRTQLVNQQKQLVYQYSGTFTASGTEFYFGHSLAIWKVSNISFSSGDTFIFQIQADLICQ